MLYEAIMVTTGLYQTMVIQEHLKETKAFSRARFPSMLFLLPEFQLEHGFYTAFDPRRQAKKMSEYFVRILRQISHPELISINSTLLILQKFNVMLLETNFRF
jgi:hypothetical protein